MLVDMKNHLKTSKSNFARSMKTMLSFVMNTICSSSNGKILQKLNAKQRELVEAQVDFEPHIVPVNGTTLTMPQIEAFAGFVIEDKEPQE
jgi:hypothetical protein